MNKVILLLAILLVRASAPLLANDPGSGFMVLYARSAFKNSGDTLLQFEMLKPEERITLTQGHLILNHVTGNLVEFSGDTTIRIDELINVFSPDTTTLWVQDLRYLFGTSHYPQLRSGAVYAGIPDLEFIFPYSPDSKSIYWAGGQELCLWWKSRRKKADSINYTVQIANIWDEVITSIPVYGNKIEIDLLPLNTNANIVEFENIFIVSIYETAHPINNLRSIAIKRMKEGRHLDPCNAQSSAELLQIGSWLEINNHSEEALVFYKRAATSGRPIYKTLLENFIKR